MKIVEVSAVFPPYRGGIGTVCRQNARMLAEAGNEVTVLTPWYNRLRATTKAVEQQDGYTIRRLPPVIEFGNAAIVHMEEHLHEADVVHLHVPFIGVGKEFLKLKPHQKLLITYHMDLIGRDWKKIFFNRYTNTTLPKLIDRADTVLVTSFDYGRHSNISSIMKKNDAKFVDLPNCVDTQFHYPKEKNQDLMKQHHIASDDKIILFVGAIDQAHYFKGVEYLIEAFGMLIQRESGHNQTGYKLLIVGDGDLKVEYQNKAAKMGISDAVIFAGNPSDDTVSDYFNLCDVMVLPSIDSSEAFGIVLLEAMACGKPVIASNLPGPRSVVEDEKNGFVVTPRDAVDLAEKLYAVLSDNVLVAEMGKRSKELVDEKYSYSVVSKRLNDIIKSL
ncbi:MAG: glycosyltransferase family 4 protein [Patescibacteria group bacterium]